ncbi:MAG: type 1 glutamine amidotransferase [Chloroflexi bacterium]|nr:type 1 glutamine amidotransferase [Chloroflexota bacterium]
MDSVWVLQHSPIETLGTIEDTLQAEGLSSRYIRPFAGEPVPQAMDSAPALVVMGGPMGVYDQERHPFLRDEMRLIEDALRLDRPILGVCLGSQLIAVTLGSSVTRGKQKEIGWHLVHLTPEASRDRLFQSVASSFLSFHWHGDIFDLPRGAVSLARSELTEHQAFCYGERVYGLLFHLEVTREIMTGMVESFAGELEEEDLDGEAILAQATERLGPMHTIGRAVFARWAELARF